MIAQLTQNIVDIDGERFNLPIDNVGLSEYFKKPNNPDKIKFKGKLTARERLAVIQRNKRNGTFGLLYNL